MRPAVSLYLVVYALLIIAALVNSSGFCIAQGRYIPDHELLLVGIAAALSDQMSVDSLDIDAARNYQASFPDCCSLGRLEAYNSSQKLSEFLQPTVVVSVEGIKKEERIVIVDNCAGIVEIFG